MKTTSVIILAAGQGQRIGRQVPKILLELAGRPLIEYVLETAQALAPDNIHLVCGHRSEAVRSVAENMIDNLVFHEQAQQLGTAHAVGCADAALDSDQVVVLYGDVPLLRAQTVQLLMRQLDHVPLTILTTYLDNPTGYGRIIRDANGNVMGIVEHKDASVEERNISEVSTGTIAAHGPELRRLIQQINNDNAQAEFYLTDCVGLAQKSGLAVAAHRLESASEVLGVNTLCELESVERLLQKDKATRLMEEGCKLMDATRLDVRGELVVGMDTSIDVNVLIEGYVKLGDRVHIGANCVLKDVSIGAGTTVKHFSMIDSSQIGQNCIIGPFARIRPDVELADDVHIGNFVEVKKSKIGNQSKINHLSYVGDSEVGQAVNVGAGTITCNYDGHSKHKTIIGNDVFVGSGTQLVAPVSIADGATIGAGSTITKDAEAGKLTLSRGSQKTVESWQRPQGTKEK